MAETARHAPASPCEDRDRGPGFLLWRAANAWQRHMREALAPTGLTYVQAILLTQLVRMESAAAAGRSAAPTQGQLAAVCQTDPTMTSQVLRTLEQKGLIERQIGDDARTRHPASTDTGRRFAAQAAPILGDVEGRFFGKEANRLTDGLLAVPVDG